MSTIHQRLADAGLTLPTPAAPVASYLPAVEHDGLLTVSGQLPFLDGELVTGRMGDGADLARGQAAARACGLMLLAQVQAALGSLDRVARVIRLGVFVSSTADFVDQAQVANGASDLMALAFGESGRHARAAVGVPVLPLGALVEVDGLFAISPDPLAP